MPYSEEQQEQRRQCDRFIYRERRAREDEKQQEQQRVRNRKAQYKYRQKQKHHFQGRDRIDETTIVPFHLKPTIICIHCEAKKFISEPNCFCCNDGKIKLVDTEMPTVLKNLFTRTDEIGKDFRNNIRAYNNLFAFTSLDFHLDQRFANSKNGIYTFRAQGSMYHAIGPFLPPVEDTPKYLQLYIYDTEHEIDNRLQIMPNLCKDNFELLKNILDEAIHMLQIFVTFLHLII
ncbi:7406_t:CDS:2 [Gigaspora rosea]|nr:7406_t:CDS:2 [Gigaspora rosea]